MNFEEIERLLNIIDKARHWPNLKSIHDAAMKRLEELASPPVAKAIPHTERRIPDETYHRRS